VRVHLLLDWIGSNKLDVDALTELEGAGARADVCNAAAEYFPDLSPVGESRAQVFKSSPREGGDSARLMFLLSIAAARSPIARVQMTYAIHE
jgi:hypothetical protein